MVLILYVTPSIFFLSNNTNVNTVGTLSLPRKGVLWIWILKVGFELMTDPDPDPGEIHIQVYRSAVRAIRYSITHISSQFM
jgi:hypothetical protein